MDLDIRAFVFLGLSLKEEKCSELALTGAMRGILASNAQ